MRAVRHYSFFSFESYYVFLHLDIEIGLDNLAIYLENVLYDLTVKYNDMPLFLNPFLLLLFSSYMLLRLCVDFSPKYFHIREVFRDCASALIKLVSRYLRII
eukprot:snap_masked-scaffold_17-processed-gene-3.26-mRNA-1 protein AED:1.00 eAED:1.00 QI:0/0/0/0/1/1/2/0/101